MEPLTTNALKIYRIAGFAVIGLILVFPFVVDQSQRIDPWSVRIALSAYIGVTLSLTYFSKWARDRFLLGTYITCFLITGWLTSLAFLNDLDPVSTVFNWVGVVTCALLFQELRWLWAYLAANYLISLLGYQWLEEPGFPPGAYYVLEGTFMLGLGLFIQLVVRERIKLRREEARRARLEEERAGQRRHFQASERQILRDLAAGASSSDSAVEDMSSDLPRRTKEELKADEITVWLLYQQQSFLECTLDISPERSSDFVGTKVVTSEVRSMVEALDHAGVLVVEPGLLADFLAPWHVVCPDMALPVGIWVALRPAGKLKGFFVLQTNDMERRWTEEEVRFASAMGDMGSMLIESLRRRRAEKELIRRNFELDSFVYRASHDLKAPLNSLMGLISLAEMETQEPQQQSYLSLMNRSVVKLDTFIQRLNEFSRITRLETQLEEIDFREMVEGIFESLQYLEGSDRIEKSFAQEGQALVMGDRFHLEIVLANLLSNAVKYQDHTKPHSYVRVEVVAAVEETVISVTDNGIGISEEFQGRLFELFFRASNQSFGSGLGLYIMRNTVRKLGGKVELESVEGEGSTFRVKLPGG